MYSLELPSDFPELPLRHIFAISPLFECDKKSALAALCRGSSGDVVQGGLLSPGEDEGVGGSPYEQAPLM